MICAAESHICGSNFYPGDEVNRQQILGTITGRIVLTTEADISIWIFESTAFNAHFLASD